MSDQSFDLFMIVLVLKTAFVDAEPAVYAHRQMSIKPMMHVCSLQPELTTGVTLQKHQAAFRRCDQSFRQSLAV